MTTVALTNNCSIVSEPREKFKYLRHLIIHNFFLHPSFPLPPLKNKFSSWNTSPTTSRLMIVSNYEKHFVRKNATIVHFHSLQQQFRPSLRNFNITFSTSNSSTAKTRLQNYYLQFPKYVPHRCHSISVQRISSNLNRFSHFFPFSHISLFSTLILLSLPYFSSYHSSITNYHSSSLSRINNI